MTPSQGIRKAFTGEHVLNYDQKSKKANWLDPDIVFGLAYRHVEPGQTILDLGIGTGLSSSLFHEAGLEVVGMDFSCEMLEMCRGKGFAAELVEHDASVAPYPFSDQSAHHAVCTGLMHLFADLGMIFGEVARVMRPGGVFAFVVAHPGGKREKQWIMGGCAKHQGKVPFHVHSEASVDALSHEYGFEPVTSLRFLSSSIGNQEMSYRACVLRKL